MNDKKQIQHIITQGLLTIEKMGNFYTDTRVGKNTLKLIEITKELYPLVQNSYPTIGKILAYASLKLNDNGTINAFRFGDIRTSLKVLRDIYCRPSKIFISHKSEDEDFVKALVKLLRIYLGSEADKIFCSSVSKYKIGVGKEIYPEIKAQFEEYDVFMIIIHSPRYYQSPICLNEMGGAWIQNSECYSFLTADCEYNDLQGVIDNNYISIKVNAKDAKERMNEFIGIVLDFFNKPQIDFSSFSQWEADRDEFLKAVCELTISQ